MTAMTLTRFALDDASHRQQQIDLSPSGRGKPSLTTERFNKNHPLGRTLVSEPLKLGIIGLGRAFTLMLPTFASHPLVKMVAASDPRVDARERFASEFGAKVFEEAQALCADSDVEAVYVASPHQFHVDHVKLAARYGKHILVEKPMALTLAEGKEMIEVAAKANIKLLVGHSHSYDLPYLRTREMIRTGAYGRVRMISALNFTDFPVSAAPPGRARHQRRRRRGVQPGGPSGGRRPPAFALNGEITSRLHRKLGCIEADRRRLHRPDRP